MPRYVRSLLSLVVLVGAALALVPGVAGAAPGGGLLLRSGLVGSTPGGPVLFGVTPGGAPWVIKEGEAKVTRSGRIEVEVRGLVIPTPPSNGTNPVATLSASVACNGTIAATTAAVPFSTAGNAEIEATVALPSPCLAPAVLLNPRGNPAVYIAASG